MISNTDPGRAARCTAASILASAAVLAALPGCNVVGPIVAVAQGPGEVPAAFEDLDSQRKTVIFVDDPANKIAQRRIRSQIGVAAQDELLRRKLIDEGAMIDARSALAMAERGGDNGPLAITEIGEAVGAEVIIYVLVTRFGMSDDGVNFQPTSELEVKILDVTSEARIWPPAGDPGYRATFSTSTGNANMPRTRTGALQAEMDLAEVTGLGLAQLFYDVERPQSLRR